MKNSIEKNITLKVPLEKVWHALTDHEEFGTWFRVKLDGPFKAGKKATGKLTYPGYEHLNWEVMVKEIEPKSRFSFTWHPYAVDPDHDYSDEVPTLVEFNLKEVDGGTFLSVTESGFETLPQNRYSDAIRMNEGGWEAQMTNIQIHVEQSQC
ncbi:MAG: SRPBCC family protein [Emcibacteraceae bacterium]